jgi:hypothetical protein
VLIALILKQQKGKTFYQEFFPLRTFHESDLAEDHMGYDIDTWARMSDSPGLYALSPHSKKASNLAETSVPCWRDLSIDHVAQFNRQKP